MRNCDPLDNLKVDVDDMVEDADGGIRDQADRPSAGEGELNRIPGGSSDQSTAEERGACFLMRPTKLLAPATLQRSTFNVQLRLSSLSTAYPPTRHNI